MNKSTKPAKVFWFWRTAIYGLILLFMLCLSFSDKIKDNIQNKQNPKLLREIQTNIDDDINNNSTYGINVYYSFDWKQTSPDGKIGEDGNMRIIFDNENNVIKIDNVSNVYTSQSGEIPAEQNISVTYLELSDGFFNIYYKYNNGDYKLITYEGAELTEALKNTLFDLNIILAENTKIAKGTVIYSDKSEHEVYTAVYGADADTLCKPAQILGEQIPRGSVKLHLYFDKELRLSSVWINNTALFLQALLPFIPNEDFADNFSSHSSNFFTEIFFDFNTENEALQLPQI